MTMNSANMPSGEMLAFALTTAYSPYSIERNMSRDMPIFSIGFGMRFLTKYTSYMRMQDLQHPVENYCSKYLLFSSTASVYTWLLPAGLSASRYIILSKMFGSFTILPSQPPLEETCNILTIIYVRNGNLSTIPWRPIMIDTVSISSPGTALMNSTLLHANFKSYRTRRNLPC